VAGPSSRGVPGGEGRVTMRKAKMELTYKKMPIADAIVMLRRFADEGATHVTMRVRWEGSSARPIVADPERTHATGG
jgi:hypothetical protein